MLPEPTPPNPETFRGLLRPGFPPAVRGQWLLYAVFLATGVGSALPGALLPSLLVLWRISDARAGLLAFALWFGSSLGALVVRRSLQRSLLAGCLLTSIGAAALGTLGGRFAPVAFLVYGLGLGTAMTSISLMQQRVPAENRNLQFIRLNLLWAAGAVLAPPLVVHALRVRQAEAVLLSLASVFAAGLMLAAFSVPNDGHLQDGGGFDRAAWMALRSVPQSLILMTVLASGIEAGGGTWLATYAQRSEHALFATVAAPTCLWAGLLSSRLLGSVQAIEVRMERRPAIYGFVVMLSLVAMVLQRSELVLVAAAYALGFGLGPLYPLLLARVMRVRAVGTIFFLAGVCSSLLPWLTGALSSGAHSLRAGLAVLVAAAAVLCALLFATRETAAS